MTSYGIFCKVAISFSRLNNLHYRRHSEAGPAVMYYRRHSEAGPAVMYEYSRKCLL